MSTRKHIRHQHNRVLYLTLISVAQICMTQFFTLYLKHLNMAAFEIGLIRACQIWFSVLLLPAWISLAKRLHSACWKRILLCVFLFIIINTYFCLTFIPLSNKLRDITHCYRNQISLPKNGITNEQISNSVQKNYTLPNIQELSSHHKKFNHKIFEDNEPNLKYHGINKISNGNSKNNTSEIPLLSERTNDTNVRLSSKQNGSKFKPYNLSESINYNYSSLNNLQELEQHNLSRIVEVQKIITKLKNNIRYNNKDKRPNLYSSQNNDLGYVTHNINSDNKQNSIVSTESSSDYETNTNNINFDYDYPVSQRNLVYKKTQKKVKNNFNVNMNHNQKLPVSSTEEKRLHENTDTTKNIEVGNSESRTEYLSEKNRDNYVSYHSQQQKQTNHPWQNHYSESRQHNLKVNNKNRLSSHPTKSGDLEKSNSQFQSSNKLKNTIDVNSYEDGMIKIPNLKPPLENRNNNKDNKQLKEDTSSSEQNGDWQILRDLLQMHRHKRSVLHKKHHKMKRHNHHHAESKITNNELNKFNKTQYQKFDLFDQHSFLARIHERTLENADHITNRKHVRKLMFLDDSDDQTGNDSDSYIKRIPVPVHIPFLNNDNISNELINIIINRKIQYILSLAFGTILLIAVLAEIFSRAVVVTSYKIFIVYDKLGSTTQHHITSYQRECSQNIWTLITWGICGCPIVAVLVLFTECSYQPRAFILFSSALIGTSLLLVLFCLHLPQTVWDWKLKDCGEDVSKKGTPFFKKFGCNISIFIGAFAMACNSEFILWYMDTLSAFPYNYQLLYCGYLGTGAVFQAVVKSWLLRKQMTATITIHDSSNADVDAMGGDGVRSIGPILLGLHFLLASVMQPAWSILFLGVLQGCSAAFLVSTRVSGCWAAGYGLGCVVGGFVVNLYSADRLFWIMAGSMFVWSALVTLSKGLLKCIGNNDRDRASYSQLLLLGEDSDKEEMMADEEEKEDDDEEEEECNDDDWLEKAMEKDEQKEDQRRRIMSCPI